MQSQQIITVSQNDCIPGTQLTYGTSSKDDACNVIHFTIQDLIGPFLFVTNR